MHDGEDASRRNRPVGFVAGFLSALLLAAGAFFAWRHFAQPQPTPGMAANIQVPAERSRVSGGPVPAAPMKAPGPATVARPENTFDKAMTAAAALRHGDDLAAAAVARQVLGASRLHAFGFSPFNRFVNHLSPGDDPDYLAGLNRWLAHDSQSALAYLLRAKYAYDTALMVRGPDRDWKVTAAHMRAYEAGLADAERDARRSIQLDPNIPWSYFLWLGVVSQSGEPVRLDEAFHEGTARFPGYYELYRLRLLYLAGDGPRRGFVAKYAGSASESSPLKLLYLQLLHDPPRAGPKACIYPTLESLIECIEEMFATSGPDVDDVKKGVAQAFALYRHIDPVEYTNALWPALDAMHGHSYEPSILQQAADAVGSNNALIHEPGHNNYALDDLTARVWERLDNPTNVAQKYQEALDDVQRMHFASDEDRDEVVATIYDHMAWTARRAAQYAQVIAFRDAANAAAGINHGGTPYLRCFALYKLNRFTEAVDECGNLIATHLDVVSGLYYRARSYEGLKQYDAAIADFAPVAENGSENYIRWGAALEMEHVLALKGDHQGELEVFRKYPWMLDPSLQPPDDLAAAYNNRCFAYMNTGELEKALDDCNTSLRYGKLPDALRKQAQLLKMLHKD